MEKGMKRTVFLASVLTLLPLFAAGQPPAVPPDFEIARDAVERGEILPLAEVLNRLAKVHPGRVVEVELEYSKGVLVYEVELVTEDGRLIEVDMNAATGDILGVEEEEDDD